MNLTPSQLRAINDPSKFLIIQAVAGSGKTSVLIERIAKVIQDGIPADQVIAISYTIASAGELQKRLEARIGTKTPLYCGTVHGFCAAILRDAGRKFSVMSERESVEFVNEVYHQYAPTKSKQARLPREKLDALLKQGPKRYEYLENLSEIDRVALAVWRKMSESSVYSYEALLYVGWKHIREKGFKCGMLAWDEFQDSAQIDILLMEAIEAEQKTLVCDPAQAIFSWRHGGTDAFEKLIKNARSIG